VQIALILPELDATLWAWAMGLGVDLYGETPPGLLAMTYALIAIAFARSRGQIFASHILTRLILVVIADLLAHLAVVFSEIIRGHPIHFLLTLRTTALDLVYTVVVALVLLPAISLVLRRLYRERRRT